ncbi:MAG TPA: CHAD domain-containing protein [Amaricoccus sp.]|nr:CHAD domain-containing protein [Amaricoccus sp.]
MIETELKITLDSEGEARLRRHPALAHLRLAPRRTQILRSVYYDTPEHALAAQGIALRLRQVGRRWVQTVKRRGESAHGLFANLEVECAAPGGRLVLDGPDPEGVFGAIDAAAGTAVLSPVFETRVRRTTERLRAPEGGEVELAIDAGEIRAGEAVTPIREAELELVEGAVGELYGIARTLFPRAPVRFSLENKSARGYRLARGEAEPPVRPRNARVPDYAASATVESVARDIFRDCLAQIAQNMVVIAESDDPEGPHQIRVGLRRLRTAFAIFGPSLGKAALAPLAREAQRLGQVVGPLRDIDVLAGEIVAEAVESGLDAAAREALLGCLAARGAEVRRGVRRTLAGPEAAGFLFDLGRLIEGRGWLAPSDYSQTERLAAPVGGLAGDLLDARLRRVRRRGRGIRKLDTEALHVLRKDLKKLRYAADTFAPIYPDAKVATYVKELKSLQDSFGHLNDAAMAAEALTGPEAPGRDDGDVQRGVGWVLGTLTVRAGQQRPDLFARWDRLRAARPFWS